MITEIGESYLAGDYKAAAAAAAEYMQGKRATLQDLIDIGAIAYAYQDFETALEAYRNGAERAPDDASIRNSFAAILIQAGDVDAARTQSEAAIQIGGAAGAAYFNLAQIHQAASGDPLIAQIEDQLKKVLPRADEYACKLALAKLYDDCGLYDLAFGHAAAAKRLIQPVYDNNAQRAFVDRLKSKFSPEFLRARRNVGHNSTAPIFIVGMPRVGSSLLETLLQQAASVAALGERADLTIVIDALCRRAGAPSGYLEIADDISAGEFAQCGRDYCNRLLPLAGDAKQFTDKNLLNYLRLGFIHLAMPNANILHIHRNPLDACLSAFMQALDPNIFSFSFDLKNLGAYYAQYERLMQHWREAIGADAIYDVKYEELAQNTASTIDAVATAIKADRNASGENSFIATASAWQARQPVFDTSIGRWKNYQRHLEPLVDVLREGGVRLDD